ncbi:hypothetical protein BC828DRAFT_364778 [Blastocladiella britannica]|nr:hypothetical protein BC828DRAFT_364778 [Blastocladiella britannica]
MDAEAQQPLLQPGSRSQSPPASPTRSARSARSATRATGGTTPANGALATWKPRTPLEKVLMGLTGGLFLASAILLGLYATSLHNGAGSPPHLPPHVPDAPDKGGPSHPAPGPEPPGKNKESEFCLTPDCVRSANRLLDAIDPSVNPCDDFFEYACGNWVRAHDIPAAKMRVGTFDALFDANKRVIRDILGASAPPKVGAFANQYSDDSEVHLFDKTKALYSACLDETTIDKKGAKLLRDLVSEFMPPESGLKLRPNTSAPIARDELVDLIAKASDLGVDAIVGAGVESDQVDPTVQAVYVAQAGLILPAKEYYLESEYTKVLERTVASVFSYLFDKDTVQVRSRRHSTTGHKNKNPAAPIVQEAEGPLESSSFPEWFWDIVDPLFPGSDRHHRHGKRPKHPKHPLPPGDGKPEPGIPEDPNHPPRDPRDPRTPEDPPLPHDPRVPPKQPSKPELPTPVPVTDWVKVAKQVVDFEKQLAAISMPNEDAGDPIKTYNPMPLADLEAKSKVIAWGPFLRDQATRNGAPASAVGSTIVAVTVEYLEKVDAIVQATPAAVVRAYVAYKVAAAYSSAVDQATQAKWDDFRQTVYGLAPGTHPPREDTCLAAVDRAMGFATGRWFVSQRFPGTSREEARAVIKGILQAFEHKLDKLTWLDPVTREKARAKSRALDRKVGFPDWISNVTTVIEKYAPLRIAADDHFGNVQRVSRESVKESWQKLDKPTDYTEWGMTPATVNAYYNPSHNEIVFPAGILQGAFFAPDGIAAVNYGAIGVVAGHELSHGFDNNGRHYDEKGRLVDWWTEETTKEFTTRAQCFVDQYSSFYVEDPQGRKIYVNGKLTLGENLADNGGLRQSWDAWKAAQQSRNGGRDERLPGLATLSSEQLFFLGFAHVWCGKARPEYALQQIRTDPHSPGFVRTNAAIQNSPEFAHAFSCPAGAPMNPEHKCTLW